MRRFLIALAACAGLLSLSAPAHAHTALDDAAPGPGSKVAPGVSVIALTLKDLKPGTTPEVGLTGPDQSAVATGPPTLIDNSVVCAAVTPLSPGVHTVSYTAVATDDDEQENKFFFEVVDGAEAPETPTACQSVNLAAPGAEESEETTFLGMDPMIALVGFAAVGAAAIATLVVTGGGGGGSRRRRRSVRRHRAA